MSAFGRRARGDRLARMRASPRWVDGRFANVHETFPDPRERTSMPWWALFFQRAGRRPSGMHPLVDPSIGWARPPESGLRATWLGHSTLLLEIGGRRILTDPVWGERASPLAGLGPKRFHSMPVALEALPDLDLVIISHDHYDHLDHTTIRRLAPLRVPFVVPLGVGAHLEAWGIEPHRIIELDWWERFELPGGEVAVTATPAQHFSGRGLRSRNSTLWSSYVAESPRHRLFFGGDTGLMPGFANIRDRLGPFDLIALEVGAYHPAWGDIHMGPEKALEAHELLGGGPLLPIHWATFDLSTHRWQEPIETLARLGSGVEILTPRLGEPVEPSRANGLGPWWRAMGGGEVDR